MLLLLLQAFLAAPPRPDMRRLRIQPAAVDSPEAQSSSWQLYPWGPANSAVNERYESQRATAAAANITHAFHCVRGGLLADLKEALPLALPIYASLINFRATAELLGRCSVRCVTEFLYICTCLSAKYSSLCSLLFLSAVLGAVAKSIGELCGRYACGWRQNDYVPSGLFGHAFVHGQRLLGSCVASRKGLGEALAFEDPSTTAKDTGDGIMQDSKQPETSGPALALGEAEAECSLDLSRPLRCPAPGAKVVCVSNYIECLRWLHSDAAPIDGCELEATRDKVTRRWVCP